MFPAAIGSTILQIDTSSVFSKKTLFGPSPAQMDPQNPEPRTHWTCNSPLCTSKNIEKPMNNHHFRLTAPPSPNTYAPYLHNWCPLGAVFHFFTLFVIFMKNAPRCSGKHDFADRYKLCLLKKPLFGPSPAQMTPQNRTQDGLRTVRLPFVPRKHRTTYELQFFGPIKLTHDPKVTPK